MEDLTEKIRDFKSRIGIDPFNLSQECERQPILYSEIGDVASQARSVVRRAKDNLDYVIAEIRADIRLKPENYGLTKVTEGALDSAAILSKPVVDAKLSLREAEEISDVLGILVTTADQRKSMIRDMVKLYIAELGGCMDMQGDRVATNKQTQERLQRDRTNKNA